MFICSMKNRSIPNRLILVKNIRKWVIISVKKRNEIICQRMHMHIRSFFLFFFSRMFARDEWSIFDLHAERKCEEGNERKKTNRNSSLPPSYCKREEIFECNEANENRSFESREKKTIPFFFLFTGWSTKIWLESKNRWPFCYFSSFVWNWRRMITFHRRFFLLLSISFSLWSLKMQCVYVQSAMSNLTYDDERRERERQRQRTTTAMTKEREKECRCLIVRF